MEYIMKNLLNNYRMIVSSLNAVFMLGSINTKITKSTLPLTKKEELAKVSI